MFYVVFLEIQLSFISSYNQTTNWFLTQLLDSYREDNILYQKNKINW